MLFVHNHTVLFGASIRAPIYRHIRLFQPVHRHVPAINPVRPGRGQEHDHISHFFRRPQPAHRKAAAHVVGEVDRVGDPIAVAGDAITIVGDHGNTFFYKHGVSNVKVGEQSQEPEIRTSGSASGSPHLHFGVKHGNPLDLIGQHG